MLAAAYAHELPRYGIKLGLTNYAAAYATGLLLARRVNAKFSLKYDGQTKVDGEEYHVEASEDEEAAKPFKALLDVGLARTTSGARVFGVLKGATDGGIDVPHNDHRYPGSKREGTEWTTSAEVRVAGLVCVAARLPLLAPRRISAGGVLLTRAVLCASVCCSLCLADSPQVHLRWSHR